jgi:signal transduction histidine kinase
VRVKILRRVAALTAALATSLTPPAFASSTPERLERLDVSEVDYQLASIAAPVPDKWMHADIIGKHFEVDDTAPLHLAKALWVRITFDRNALPSGSISFYTNRSNQSLQLELNGKPIYRSFKRPEEWQYGWNRPRLIDLPESLLQLGSNEVVLRLSSRVNSSVRLGPTIIGNSEALAKIYQWRHGWQVLATQAITVLLGVFSLAALIFWLARRTESASGWLALFGFNWVIRNWHIAFDYAPVEPSLYWNVTELTLYTGILSGYGFATSFLKVPRERSHLYFLIGSLIVISLSALDLLPLPGAWLVKYIAPLIVSFLVLFLLLQHSLRAPLWTHTLMLAALISAIVLSAHDLGLMSGWWQGATIYLQPFAGMFVFTAFAAAMGQRMIGAFSTVENLNTILAKNVADTEERLKTSEAARRSLEVSAALEKERDRIMREMHDGVGSELVTALSVAERQGHPQDILGTLRKALLDLKLTVDSLEPMEGDVVTLLASLRHRIEPDLQRAQIRCRWNVEPCPALQWLDAPSALHVLRLVQESVSNTLQHANATEITFHCKPAVQAAIDGVEIRIEDNGHGFAPDLAIGKGLKNMRHRTSALGGTFVGDSDSTGTRVTLWFPLLREPAA